MRKVLTGNTGDAAIARRFRTGLKHYGTTSMHWRPIQTCLHDRPLVTTSAEQLLRWRRFKRSRTVMRQGLNPYAVVGI
jgi:hypothetical protein